MDRQKFAFDKTNFILLAIGMAVIIVGFLLMTGPSSTEGYFEPDIFSVRRIKVAPAAIPVPHGGRRFPPAQRWLPGTSARYIRRRRAG